MSAPLPGAGLQLGLSALLFGWVATIAVVSGVAIARALRLRRRQIAPIEGPPPRVLVVRPCAGLEPHLRRTLESTATLRYRGSVRVVLSTSHVDDPARPVLLAAAETLRARGLEVSVEVVAPRGSNLKASQLAGVIDPADDDLALVIDSDVELEGLDLDRMLAPLADPAARVAAVWCAPVERAPASLADRMSAAVLGGSLHAFSLLGRLEPHGLLVGKTFAVRLTALRRMGGFAALVQHLGEDMELARRLREQGSCVQESDTVVSSLASRRSVGQVLARYARWLLVIRAQRPALLASYPLLLAATPGLLAAGSLAIVRGLPGAALAVVVAVVTRLGVGVVARALAGRPLRLAGVALDAVLADALLLAAFVRAALGPARVRWRERSLRLGARGLLVDPPIASG